LLYVVDVDGPRLRRDRRLADREVNEVPGRQGTLGLENLLDDLGLVGFPRLSAQLRQ
jgi:hypothetical protein